MGSLADLNSYSEEPISFTDLRPADVIFVVPIPEDQETITTTEFTFTVFRPYDIVEIIRPELTNITYSVDVSAVAGTVVNWPTIPSGSTVSEVNGVYTINGIDSLDKWNTVNNPVITVPASFNGSFFYSQSINYSTAQGRQSYAWQVGSFIPQAQFELSFTQTVQGIRAKGLFINEMVAAFGLTATAAVSMNPATFSAQFNQATQPNKTASGRFNRTAVFNSSINISATTAISNAEVQRFYIANTGVQIFNQAPQPVITLLQDGSLYRIRVSVSSGYLFGNTVESESLLSGIKNVESTNIATLQDRLRGLRYYPFNYNETATQFFNLTLFRNNVLIKEYSVQNLVNNGTDTSYETGKFDTVTATQGSWFPDREETLYANRLDFWVIGAGGGGANNAGGGGGGAGERKLFTIRAFNPDVNFVLQSGGQGGAWGAGSFGVTNAGGQGQAATWRFSSQTAGQTQDINVLGGFGGGDGSNGIGLQQGSNSPGLTRTGGDGFINEAGGGGVGNTDNGGDAVSTAGGKLAGPGGAGTMWDGFEHGRGGGGAENGISAYRLNPYGIGTGGHGASSFVPSHNQNGGPSGVLIRVYRA